MANLFASVGPSDVPGVLVSGHTDVVPVAGQAWTLPPFEGLRRRWQGTEHRDQPLHAGLRDPPPTGGRSRQPGRRAAGSGGQPGQEARQTSAKAAIEIETTHAYPGLATHPSVEAVRLLQRIVEPGTTQRKMAFGTLGGLFGSRLDTPVVVCGPGGIEQAPKPDEYVELSQLAACDALLRRSRVALG